MNVLITAGQVEVKDALKPKNKEIIELSGQIEQTTKKTQRIYDNQEYLNLCVLLEEQEKYGELSLQKLQKGLASLK